ncbi:alpha/beta fold hydrolase [Synechococcus sp. CBW1004]|uniref:alpha/beta fold hydrolase n=1 Tax=Synechococcus sp. CBW1004 TaxID=1353136 RepID=UPI0018CF7C8E|nr:alpha/beta hydrolase [Synechococcus sp. CBW1004]QPN63813.1 alpha/beta fold hydrolase [Synechococcus sp. CBW1004]
MPFQRIGDLDLFYQQIGSGPDVVMISGLSADHQMWETARLAPDFRVTVFDNRGCGQSSIPEGPYRLEMLARDTLDLCASLGIHKAHLVGHSMGGHIAQIIAAIAADFVDRLVIACSEPIFSVISQLATSQQIALYDCGVPLEVRARNYLPVLFDMPFLKDSERVESYIRSVVSHPHPMTQQGYVAQTEALRVFDTRALLKQIRCPTRIIAAEHDLLTPMAGSEFLCYEIPGAELSVIPDSGHGVFIERPEMFYGLILEFLKGGCGSWR